MSPDPTATTPDLDALTAEYKQLCGQLSGFADHIAHHVQGPVTEPVRKEHARYKQSLKAQVQLLERLGAPPANSVYETLRTPSFPAHDRLQEAANTVLSVVQSLTPGQLSAAALLDIAKDLALIVANAPPIQPPEPDVEWVARGSQFTKDADDKHEND
ncbi:hypothetical protein [Mycobacteroides salmoniphilum]|uniref:Uncharacterized protein n=1 Tax=Mycobacteroides salmoniphilum TaxID=404941 RepID=A0A4R8SZN5_9MYCO|nr:hypothetical protein [Mycobacteroides salmoniphilum]TEA09075.1 hypothetical protein CCUG60884_00243 [Mycobacteroides salmoniphilum]